MKAYLTVGVVALAGAALLEAALVPGLVIGGAAVLAPAVLPKLYRRARRPVRSPRSISSGSASRPAARRANDPAQRDETKTFALPAWVRPPRDPEVRRAILKTITFRLLVTTLDFSGNLLVIGELAPAAGLSAFSLVAGPVFYFAHETLCNSYGPGDGAVDVRLPRLGRPGDATSDAPRVFVLSRAVAKTITFRTFATAMEFTANYIVTGDVATAALLSSFGFVLGPFVYLGHEMAWDRLASPQREPLALPAPPAAASA